MLFLSEISLLLSLFLSAFDLHAKAWKFGALVLVKAKLKSLEAK